MSRLDDELEAQTRRMENLLGDLRRLLPFFDTPSVTNVYVYGDGSVQVDDFQKGIYEAGFSLSVLDRMRIINSLASVSDTPIDKWERPTLESIIPKYNIRTTAIIPPWTKNPEITFRRPAEKVYTLEEYVSSERLSNELYKKIIRHLEKRANIVVSGSTGSGKTTFTNALIAKMAELTPDERFYIIEDTPELQCAAKNTTQLYIRKEQAVAAIQTALRWTPKRIIFGELRSGDVAVELLEAWNTGHPGNVTTIHADSAASTITRLEGLLRQKIAGALPDLSWSIGLIIHLGSRAGFGPFVHEALTLDEIAQAKSAGGEKK
ncbi:MAG: Flp pilus assembly complex ATPase component TadA [Spirochaetaceae bacterium]|jgi:type IV secretion system protein VirB11|nr:Flp pilus assembly complex ATPase component TadA [Spirochaetaceae bacterium]